MIAMIISVCFWSSNLLSLSSLDEWISFCRFFGFSGFSLSTHWLFLTSLQSRLEKKTFFGQFLKIVFLLMISENLVVSTLSTSYKRSR